MKAGRLTGSGQENDLKFKHGGSSLSVSMGALPAGELTKAIRATMPGGRVLEADRLMGAMTDSKISTQGYEVLDANQ